MRIETSLWSALIAAVGVLAVSAPSRAQAPPVTTPRAEGSSPMVAPVKRVAPVTPPPRTEKVAPRLLNAKAAAAPKKASAPAKDTAKPVVKGAAAATVNPAPAANAK